MKIIPLIFIFIISIFQLTKKDTSDKIISSICTDSIIWEMNIVDENGNTYIFRKKMPVPITRQDSLDLWNGAVEEIRITRIREKFY